ncbi:hypothetical protein ACLRDC_08340 [Gluconacetobacter sacchari]|uniref:DUF4440 domain-containing protein n=2 Tax=Gluconacetobacter sacchari TaxID=92759 RepID=A0A7W4NMI8_9PROT|nr:hypothetical protein [Gluconacetobacter sacchari]MBB2160512.1 hypothetical protein [Gluconacetobacter sacchari]GBQ32899.1 hypothetical protein AA12717_4059 [Gluconacetobacter sacchari DSM 12717]
MTDRLLKAAHDEIVALHVVLQAWFRGEGTSDPATVLKHFTPDYAMVGAAGRLLPVETFATALPTLHGSRPGLVMTIEDVALRHVFPGGLLATYREIQTQGETRTERWSSVTFAEGPDDTLLWAFLQETFCA